MRLLKPITLPRDNSDIYSTSPFFPVLRFLLFFFIFLNICIYTVGSFFIACLLLFFTLTLNSDSLVNFLLKLKLPKAVFDRETSRREELQSGFVSLKGSRVKIFVFKRITLTHKWEIRYDYCKSNFTSIHRVINT